MRHKRLILQEDVPSLGDAGDVVTVKAGYARNYLLPRGLAAIATEANLRQLEHQKRVVAEKVARARKELEAQRTRIEALVLEVTAQAGQEGRLFGSVTAVQLAEALAAQGVEVDRRRIELSEPIKDVGEHTVPVRLHRELKAQLRVRVVAAG